MKRFILPLLLITSLQIYSIEYKTALMNLSISDSGIKYYVNEGVDNGQDLPDLIELKSYTKVLKSNVPFYSDGNNEMLILSNNEIAFAYSKNSKRALITGINSELYDADITMYNDFLVSVKSASSYLVEGDKKYTVENLRNPTLETSWVEGVVGYGINEKIVLNSFEGNGLYFFNGYVSFSSPDLYSKNSRVKKLKVTDLNTNISIVFDIEDTPNPQLLDLKLYKLWNIELEIIDVYKGSLYKDTCINSIYIKWFD